LKVVNACAAGTHLEIDLSEVNFAHPSGMAPLVALVQHLTTTGWSFDVIFPSDDHLADYFTKAGWEAGIRGEAPPHRRLGASYFPLTPYTDHESLNPLMNAIVEHLASTAVYETGVIDAIASSLNEVADNVLLHAGERVSGWVQMVEQPKKNLIEFVVVDCGRGITESLRQRFTLKDDREAVMKAVEKGVTRDPSVGQGNGLAGTLRIAAASKGWANIHSGAGALRAMQDQPLICQIEARHLGTLVEVTLPTDRPINLAEALWGFEPMHELEMNYLQDHGQGVLVRVAEEATGFGNRASAKPVRFKVRNLMVQFPTEPITIDFDGATLISASFADELIARLVKEIGVTRFFSQVRLVNLSELARRTIDAVVAQRLADQPVS
jgi:anti-sigma regulatory factor (Ser/Thr protein kinase)